MSKKDFSKRPNPAVIPAMQFITQEAEVVEAEEAPKKKREAGAERKTKRLNLLMLPSVMEDMQKIATMERTSVNDLINMVLKEYVEEHRGVVEKYDEVF